MKCKGKETRIEIVKKYGVKPIIHSVLLNKQTKRSDAEATIKNEYYIFKVMKKETNEIVDYIQCGLPTARHFLELTGEAPLPIFNPLKGNQNNEGATDAERSSEGENPEAREEKAWNPVAKQLRNAIMWLFVLWDVKPGTPICEFKEEIEKYYYCEPFPGKVKRVNTVIHNGGKGKTLTQMIKELAEDNDIRESLCQFDLLEKVMDDLAISSWF